MKHLEPTGHLASRIHYDLFDLLETARAVRPQHIALVDGENRISYEALTERAEGFRELFLDAGIRRGDRVAIYLPRSVDAVSALFGAWSAGAVGVIVNDILKARQVDYILKHSEASLLVTNERLFNGLDQPPLLQDRILITDRISLPFRASRACPSIGSDLALLIYTSGSTGMPKGVMLSHSNLLAGAYIVSDYLALTEDDILISLLPFSFDYGLNQLLTAILVCGTLVIEHAVLPAEICNTMERERVTGMACVPMLWQQLAQARSPFLRRSFPTLRYMTNTGGRMSELVIRALRTAHPETQLFLMFGLTEAFRSTFLPPNEVDRRPTSIGKAIPNCEILLVNQEGNLCAPGEVGELVHRGATVSMGYWKDPDATASRFRPAPFSPASGGPPEIAVYSGDYAYMDEEGYLYFVGRKDQMIKSRGMRISPEEIEECVHASGLAAHVVAFSSPKNETEARIVVAIVPQDPTTFRSGQVIDYAKREMPDYMRPDVVWTINQFPVTSTGKPDRVRLKEMFEAGSADQPQAMKHQH